MIRLSNTIRNSRLQVIVDEMDKATTGGQLFIYSGSAPVIAGGILSNNNTLLSTMRLDTVSAVVLDGVLTFNPILPDTNVENSGNASWCRILDGNGVFILDGDVGGTESEAFIKMDNISLVESGSVVASQATITEGNS